MSIHRRLCLAVGLGLVLAGATAASAFGAATLKLETPNLGNLKGAELIGKGGAAVIIGETEQACGDEAFGEVTTNEKAKDYASFEFSCAVVAGSGKLEMSAKSTASLSAPSGKKFSFLYKAPGEECTYQTSKLKGTLTELTPVDIYISAMGARDTKVSSLTCPKKAYVEMTYELWAAEPPFRQFEEPITGKILG